MMDILHGRVSVTVPLLNYTTKIPAEQTSAEIMSILVKKGATEILTHYGPGGMATGLKWRMETPTGAMGFSLPINADAVFQILTRHQVIRAPHSYSAVHLTTCFRRTTPRPRSSRTPSRSSSLCGRPRGRDHAVPDPRL